MTKQVIDSIHGSSDRPRERSAFGKLWRGVARGVVDGSPILGPVVTAFATARKGAVIEPTARIFSSSATTVAVLYLFLERLAGGIDMDRFLQLLSLVLHGQ